MTSACRLLLRLCNWNGELLMGLHEDLAVIVGKELASVDQANHIATALAKAQNQIIRARTRLATSEVLTVRALSPARSSGRHGRSLHPAFSGSTRYLSAHPKADLPGGCPFNACESSLPGAA